MWTFFVVSNQYQPLPAAMNEMNGTHRKVAVPLR